MSGKWVKSARRRFMAASGAALVALGVAVAAPPLALAENGEAKRIVSIGGAVTEIIYALGEEDRLIARDQTSTYPPEAAKLPDVGYIRALSPEGVLSVNPDMIIALEGYGPPEAVSVLAQAGVPIIEIPDGFDGPSILAKIMATAKALGRKEAGEALADKVAAELEKTEKLAASIRDKRKILFVLSLQGGRILAAGANTHADGIIRMAGATNAVKGFEGYKPITDEAVIEAAPEVILMMNRGGDHDTVKSEVLSHPAIAMTPAGKSSAFIRMDGLYILGFGPRTASAARDLGEALYGEASGQVN